MHYQIRTDIRASLFSSYRTGTIANSYAFGHLKWGGGYRSSFRLILLILYTSDIDALDTFETSDNFAAKLIDKTFRQSYGHAIET
jgi:hypothetical protein